MKRQTRASIPEWAVICPRCRGYGRTGADADVAVTCWRCGGGGYVAHICPTCRQEVSGKPSTWNEQA